jgi:hypothetical protein
MNKYFEANKNVIRNMIINYIKFPHIYASTNFDMLFPISSGYTLMDDEMLSFCIKYIIHEYKIILKNSQDEIRNHYYLKKYDITLNEMNIMLSTNYLKIYVNIDVDNVFNMKLSNFYIRKIQVLILTNVKYHYEAFKKFMKSVDKGIKTDDSFTDISPIIFNNVNLISDKLILREYMKKLENIGYDQKFIIPKSLIKLVIKIVRYENKTYIFLDFPQI